MQQNFGNQKYNKMPTEKEKELQKQFHTLEEWAACTNQVAPVCPSCRKRDIKPVWEGWEIVDCKCGCSFKIVTTTRFSTKRLK